jgi:hypothetical protein
VVLCGDDPGTEEVSGEHGTEWIRDITRNEFGTPLVSSVFRAVERRAEHELLCYVNADIVLLSDFITAACRVAEAKRRFLMVGQRWDLDVSERLALQGDAWEMDMRRLAREAGALHPPWGSDYFVYPRGVIGSLPPFAVGRPGWDNWMIYRARCLRVAVVDATACAFVIHQNHDYRHVTGAVSGTYEGPEGRRNVGLLGPHDRLFTLKHVTHHLIEEGLVPSRGWRRDDVRWRIRTALIIAPMPVRFPLCALRGVWRSSKRLMMAISHLRFLLRRSEV